MASATSIGRVTTARPWRRGLAWAAVALAVALLALNLYGLTQPVRSPLLAAGGWPGQMFDPPLAGEAAMTRLATLPKQDRAAFALQAAEIIGQSMAHLSKRKLDRAGIEPAGYHYTVPVWSNYLLFALRYLKPDTYRMYEYCSWRHAVARGVGQCGQKAMAVTGFLREHGYRTGFIHLPSHVIATAEVAPGQWYTLDADFRAYMPMDIDTLVAQPALLRQYYAHSDEVMGQFDRLFLSRAPQVYEGGPTDRYPRACIVEQVAHVAKWALPAALLAFAGLLLFWRRREPTTG